ncbi:MAG: hypothetical protein J6K15_06420 [Lachnospiraceae bacterium]|nr:hypothetical protein [Lachnospiraceae bacterium]MBP3577727.1 hypothetical protein [Lachnospiraceae bacterium]
MKEKVTHNFGLKLLSVGLAALLWLVVINSQDPVETVTFEDIPVTIINEASLVAKDKIPEIVEGDTISVVVEARRTICEKLTKDDIIAVADFEKISVTDAVPIDVSVNSAYARDVEIVRGLNQVMKLRLEDSITKDFRVKISTTGQTKEGYVIGDMVASPNMISITGSSTQISKIKEVVLMVDVDGIFRGSVSTGVPVIYDMNGDVVNSSKVSISTSEVQVTVPVLKTKTVRIIVTTTGEPAVGYEVGSISYQPDMVTVAGTLSELVLLGSTLKAQCDITDQSGVVEENIDIASLWNESLESLRLVDEDKLAVTITMKPYEEKVFEITPGAVELRGLSDEFLGKILSLSVSQVHITGKEASIQGINLQKLAPYIDLSNITTEGVHLVPVYLENLGDLILDDILQANVHVELRPRQNEEPDAPVTSFEGGEAGTAETE